MSDNELLKLARERDGRTTETLKEMLVERPDLMGRQLRDYLFVQVDRGRMRPPGEKVIQIDQVRGGVHELACGVAEFSSGAHLEFRIQLEDAQGGWRMKQFRFHLQFHSRSIDMVRIHLKPKTWHDPLKTPRCHIHIGSNQVHIPFPMMEPSLILDLICEYLEPNFGV